MSLKSPTLQILRITRELEAAQRRIRDLERHLGVAIAHIKNEHRPPADLIVPATNLLENKS